jgi:pyruvate/2-oxoglutarate dehydrogenase complex dihydrolipoamide acyltransferase (E2) component
MSKKMLKTIRCVAVLSLAGVLGLWVAARAAAAEGAAAAAPQPAASPAAKAIETAAKDNKFLFIYFWREDTQYSRVMRGVLQAAMAKMSDQAESVEVQVADPAEQAIVKRYGVDRAPMPMVLALAPNGAITKGLPVRFDENQLREAFVSRCTAECMKALQDRKLVLLCVGRPSPQAKQVSVQQGVKDFAADPQYAKSTEVVTLDASDPTEAPFLKSLLVDPQTSGPVTVVMSPPGSVLGSYLGEVTAAQLDAKIKAAQSGCGPGCACHH